MKKDISEKRVEGGQRDPKKAGQQEKAAAGEKNQKVGPGKPAKGSGKIDESGAPI